MKKNAAVTLGMVAEACRVSTMTVSRALREDSPVRPETRELVRRTAEALGYIRTARQGRPPLANSLRRQVQLILGSGGGELSLFHLRLLTALDKELSSQGFECLIRCADGEWTGFMRLVERVKRDPSAAVMLGIFLPEQLTALLGAASGAVLVDGRVPESVSAPCSDFSFDDRRAGYLGAEHLLRMGRKKILVLAGPEGNSFSDEFRRGAADALLRERGEVPPETLRPRTGFAAADAAAAVRAALDGKVEFDAVLTTDEMATGVYRVFCERGIRIPEEIAVCGCDDLPVGEQLYPELTTISLDCRELAACVAAHLVSGRSRTLFVRTKLPPKLRIRSSSGAGPLPARRGTSTER